MKEEPQCHRKQFLGPFATVCKGVQTPLLQGQLGLGNLPFWGPALWPTFQCLRLGRFPWGQTPDPQLLVCDVVQLLNCVQLFAAPWTAACQATLFFTISWSLLTLVFIESVMLSHHLTFCYPLLLLPCLSHHQSRLWWWVGCSHQVAKVLELYLQHQSFQVLPMNVQDWFPLGSSGLILLSKGLSRVFYSTAIWKHQFLGAQPSLWSNSHICTWLLEKP